MELISSTVVPIIETAIIIVKNCIEKLEDLVLHRVRVVIVSHLVGRDGQPESKTVCAIADRYVERWH